MNELSNGGTVRDRLIVALADPQVAARARRTPAMLVAVHDPLTVFEWLGAGTGLVVLDYDAIPPAELRSHVDRVLGAHERGLLFVAVAGGDSTVDDVLKAADAAARRSDQIGLYHVDGTGRVRRVAGRRLPELERVDRALPSTPPLSLPEIEDIARRGRAQREEAIAFVRKTSGKFPHLTVALIAVCVLLFVLTAGGDARAQHLYLLLRNDAAAVREGQLWRLFTYAFLHSRRDMTHVLVNMLSLYSLGSFLEPILGRRRLATIFAVTALAGGIASTLFTGGTSVGASGAVWGLLGATLGLLQGKRAVFPAIIARSLRQRLIVILLINLALSFLPSIDRYAHLGGGLAGYLLALLLSRSMSRPAPPSPDPLR